MHTLRREGQSRRTTAQLFLPVSHLLITDLRYDLALPDSKVSILHPKLGNVNRLLI